MEDSNGNKESGTSVIKDFDLENVNWTRLAKDVYRAPCCANFFSIVIGTGV